MKKMTILLAFFLSATLFFTACEDDEIETIPLGPVNISLYEAIYTGGRDLYFQVYTDREDYPATYTIRYDTEESEDQLVINLLDIQKRDYEGYETVEGPARASVFVGTFSPGTYSLKITVGEQTTSASLEVNPNFYAISPQQGESLTFNHDTLRRISEGALWGYVGYVNPSQAEVADSFRDSLESMGALPLNLAPGNYGYFQVSDTGTFTQPIEEGVEYYREFFKEYNGTETELSSLVNYYETYYRYLDFNIFWVRNSPTDMGPYAPRFIDSNLNINTSAR
ncbi:MAG: hypothetical protein ACLFPE_05475 [Bacteroidales bacterium]